MMGQMKRHYLEQADRDAVQEEADKHWRENPPMTGEIFDDGQFRGNRAPDVGPPPASIRIGDYALWEGDDITLYILFEPTGQIGAFRKEHFQSHVAAFFGLHF
jgi:hypothetical protein